MSTAENGGNQNVGDQQPWYADIQDPDAKALMEAKGYKTPADAAVAYSNLHRYTQAKLGAGKDAGHDVLTIPGEGATAEDWAKVHTALGRPDSADKYDLKFSEGATFEQPFVDWAKSAFHAAGLNPRQAQQVTEAWQKFVSERTAGQLNDMELANQKAIDTLHAQYRSTGRDFEGDVAAGQRAVQALGLSAATMARLDFELGLAGTTELLAKVGKLLASGAVDTPEAAAAEINKRLADKDYQDSLRNKYHPSHKENLQAWETLHAKASLPRGQQGAPASPPKPSPTPAAAKNDAPAVDGDRGAALQATQAMSHDQAFQASLRDVKHPLRQANLAKWEQAFKKAYG